jgi:hypothetical protein
MAPRFTSSAAVDFHVVNRAGMVLLSTPHRDIARKRARELAARHDDIEVREVTVTTSTRRIYRPPTPKPDPLTVPAMGQAVPA